MKRLLIVVLALIVSPATAAKRDLNPVEDWLFTLAMKAAPPATAWAPPTGPHADETPEQRAERYRQIARDIYAVAYHPKMKPIAGMSRKASAGFVAAMSLMESAWAPDADRGPCWRDSKEHRYRCDGGLAVGILQVQFRAKVDRAYYFEHRRALIAKGMNGLRRSFNACRELPRKWRLAAYGAGRCDSAAGREASAKRMREIDDVLAMAPAPAD